VKREETRSAKEGSIHPELAYAEAFLQRLPIFRGRKLDVKKLRLVPSFS
jgi:hypothetical protein